MFFIKKIVTFLLLITIFGCSTENIVKINTVNDKSIAIETPNNKYNILLKEYLKRKFNNEKELQADFVLKADISFTSNKTLSLGNSKAVNTTSGLTKYTLIDNNSNLLVKSGSIKTFPTLGFSSNSLCSNERSLDHIKERLSQNSANKLYIITHITLRKLIEN